MTRVRLELGACLVACACATNSELPDDSPSGGSGGQSQVASGGSSMGGATAASGAGGTASGGMAPGAGSSGAAPAGAGGSTAGGSSGASGAPVATGGSKSAGGAPASGGTNSSGASGSPMSPSGGASGGRGGSSGGGGTVGTGGNGGSSGAPAAQGCDWTAEEGKTVLFDGTSLAQWQTVGGKGAAPWTLDTAEKAFEVVPNSGNIQSKATFEDVCLHVEYLTPMYPASVTGQERGNSGIYIKSAYELQVLDSVGQPAATNTCGAVYGVRAPLEVACNEQLVWNTYEIEFKGSEWTGSTKTQNATVVSARLNGKLVQQNVDLNVSSTEAGRPDAAGPQPIMLQDHGNPVRYRNIWATIPTY